MDQWNHAHPARQPAGQARPGAESSPTAAASGHRLKIAKRRG